MGLILGPLILLWLGASSYSLWVGYILLSGAEFYPYTAQILGAAFLMMSLYVYQGLSKFKHHRSLGAFEIPLFFNFNLFSILVFVGALLLHLWGVEYKENEYVKAVPFVLMFATSLGTIVGTFSANMYMEKKNISKTY